jgi:hypothetical protein
VHGGAEGFVVASIRLRGDQQHQGRPPRLRARRLPQCPLRPKITTAALELEAAGMWDRRDGGYFIVADEMVKMAKMAIDFNERSDRLRTECAQRGEHPPSDDGHKSGWVICGHCGIPLQRPYGGPVALPNGGPLGPDPRKEEPETR